MAFWSFSKLALGFFLVILTYCDGKPAPQSNDNSTPSGQDGSGPEVKVVKSDIKPLDKDGSFSYDIELSDGTKLIQMGRTEPPSGTTSSSGSMDGAEDGPGIRIEGSYSYTSPEGKEISVTYVADEKGFQPKGDVIPMPPDVAAAASEPMKSLNTISSQYLPFHFNYQ